MNNYVKSFTVMGCQNVLIGEMLMAVIMILLLKGKEIVEVVML